MNPGRSATPKIVAFQQKNMKTSFVGAKALVWRDRSVVVMDYIGRWEWFYQIHFFDELLAQKTRFEE